MFVKKKPTPVQAFVLGEYTEPQLSLIRRGLLSEAGEGLWRLNTREAMGEGELMRSGDYIKLDSIGMPYPVAKDWFEANHTLIREGWYIQQTAPRKAWRSTMPVEPEIWYLLDKGLLRREAGAFSAFLWGTTQTAAEDAVIIFDSVECGPDGALANVEFHFVDADEFEKTYDIL